MAENKTREQLIIDAQQNLDNKDYDAGIADFEKVLALDATNPDVFNSLGDIYLYGKQDYDKAIGQYELTVKYDPKHKFAFYNLAFAYSKKGEIDKAIQYYKKAIEVDPGNPAIYNDLGSLYLNENQDYDKAIEQYELGLQYDPAYNFILYNLAFAFSKKGEIDKAIEYYKKAIEADPGNAAIYNDLGSLYLNEKKDYDKAIEQYELALKYDPGHKFAFYNLPFALSKKGEIDKAIDYYEKAIDTDKTDPDIYVALGNIYLNEKRDYDKAIEQYELALKYDPKHKLAYYNLAFAFSRKGEIDKAIEYYKKAIGADPLNPDIYNEWGNLYQYEKQDYDKAIEQYELALKYDPKHKFALYNLGDAFRKKGEIDKTIDCYRKIAEADQGNPSIHIDLGNVYLNEKQDYDKATEQYELALKYDPKNKVAFYNMLVVFSKKGEMDKAIDYYEKAVEADKTNADIYVALGDIYFNEKQDYDKAIEQYDLALKNNPGHKLALYNLAYAYNKKREIDKAIGYYKKAIEADPGNADINNDLGTVYLNDKQDYDKAIEQYELALKTNPRHKFALGNLALAFVKKGQIDNAIECYKKAIEVDPASPGIYNDLGNVYLNEKQDYDKAIEQYELALKYDPLHKVGFYNLPFAFSKKGETDKAIDYYKKAIKGGQADPDIYNELGNVYLNEKHDYDKAIEEYELALKKDSQHTVALYNLAFAFSKKGEIDKAIELYKKGIDIDSANPDTYNNLGNIYLNDKQDFDKAIEQYELALKYDPKHKFAFYNLPLALSKKGETNKVIDYYKKAVEGDKTNPDIYVALGNIYLNEQQGYNKAIEQYELALKYDPKHKSAFYNLLLAFTRNGDFDKAFNYYEIAIGADKTNPDVYVALGDLYLNEKQDYDKAIEQYELALKYDPKHKGAFSNLAFAYIRKGELEKTIKYYEKAIEADKENPDIYFALGDLYLNEKQDYDKAIKQYELALRYNPNHKGAFYNLPYALIAKGEVDRVITYYEKAIKDGKTNPDIYVALGDTYLNEKQDYDKAIVQYEQALKFYPQPLYAFTNIAYSYSMLLDFNKALEYCDKALKINEKDYSVLRTAAAVNAQAKKTDRALEFYLKLVELNPDAGDAHIQLGLFYTDVYDLNKAHSEFSKNLQLESKAPANVDNKDKLADAYYYLGNLYLEKFLYVEALEQYDSALKVNPSYVFAQHNKAWVYEKLGQYKTAKEEWNNAIRLYDADISNKKDANTLKALKYFYYAEILNYDIEDTHPKNVISKIESYYREAIKLDPASIFFRLSLLKFCLKQKGLFENKKQTITEFQPKINEFHIKALYEYRKGIELLQQRIQKQKNKSDLVYLGEFYLVMEQYKEAVKVFEDAIQLDENFSTAHIGLGVAQSKMEDYIEAIKCFKKALLIDPDDLNVQSNLADAYLKCEKLSLAEETYKKILQVTSCHLDALLGLGEYYKLVADKMAEDGKVNDAEEYLQQADEMYKNVQDQNEDFSSSSKRLNNDELAGLYYSWGYVNVKLYEINEGLRFRPLKKIYKKSYLKSALECFLKIKKKQPNYYKAQTAIKKINKQSILDVQAIHKTAPLFISILSLIVCITIQIFLWWGHPVKKDVFVVDKTGLQNFITENKLGSYASKLAGITGEKFNTQKEVEENLAKAIPVNDSLINKIKDTVIEKTSVIELQPIELMPYALITFGSLVFMVVGLYLTDISKLKFGSIELEKTTSETISTSRNLGISK